MQKRTNPLELKVDNPAARHAASPTAPTPTKVTEPVDEVVAPAVAEQPKIETETPKAVEPPRAEKPAPAPSKPPVAKRTPMTAVEQTPAATSPKQEASVAPARELESKAPSATAPASETVRWQMVTNQRSVPAPNPVPEPKMVVEPEPDTYREPEDLPEDQDDILVEETEEISAPVSEPTEDTTNTEVTTEERSEESTEDTHDTDDKTPVDIEDEPIPLTIADYELAASFSMCGRVSRGMKMGKISRDVCRLAQLMHPDQSLSTILENALLTRIYLENRDAFDALVVMLEKKGGHIKC